MLMNNKGIMRTFEAIIAAVIMILGIAFILTDTGVSFSPNPSWEVINAKNSAEDVLVVLEKGVIEDQSEIGYYINRGDINSLDKKLQSLIPPSYVYKFNVFELENVVYIETTGDAVDNSGTLSNDYIIGTSLLNNAKIWKFHESETGWPGIYTIYFPNGGSVNFYGILIVDQLTEIPGYDSLYINLESETPNNFTSSSTKLSSTTPLKVGDTISFTSVSGGAEYEYEYLISNISIDGNSISLALIGEKIKIDFLGTDSKDVKIFDETFRFILSDNGIVDSVRIEKKIGEPDKFTSYLTDIQQDTWTNLGYYRANIISVSYDGSNGYLIAQLIPFKRNIISIEKPGQIETTISSKRVVSVWDSSGVRAFYVSLVMGREKYE
ncbi:MAG TPA: hypothetical protein PLO36_03730 [Methanofastidiosum sp.]|nr:hypothetical protein [Methanofastidiosum sp.]